MNNYEKHALRVSYSYRGSRQGLVQARTLARCSRKLNTAIQKIESFGRLSFSDYRVI